MSNSNTVIEQSKVENPPIKEPDVLASSQPTDAQVLQIPNLKNKELISLLTEEYKQKWTREQEDMRSRLILEDTIPWQLNQSVYNKYDYTTNRQYQKKNPDQYFRYIGACDISFVKDEDTACSGLFVFDISDKMKLVYQDIDQDLIKMTLPYVPGFLAYREAPFLLSKLEKLKKTNPNLYPQCILIDGNGLLHSKRFGIACHIGLLSDTPTIGVSKTLFQVFGLNSGLEFRDRVDKELKNFGDYFELRTQDSNNELLGYCYRTNSKKPVYVSIGHKISWKTCLWVMKQISGNNRIPEPIRQADLITRAYLRNKDGPEFTKKGKRLNKFPEGGCYNNNDDDDDEDDEDHN